jgi:alpha-tubulin suppressor-like RCC1 family protein
MPNPNTNFRDSSGLDLGNKLITKEYLMSVYPQIANQLITPELWIWGSGYVGRLGTNNTTNSSTPVTTFAGGANWKQVAGGSGHTAAIKTDGTLWTWGYNDNPFEGNGFLGTNDSTDRSTPVTTFAGGTNWKQVACGYYHTAAIKTDGTLWTWGVNYNGQLGDNGFSSSQIPITTFSGGTNWKQVAGGSRHTAAIKTDGTLWTWGGNAFGELGDNTLNKTISPVTTFTGGTNWKQVACGYYHTIAVKTDGTLWTWGQGSFGQLGNNATTERSTPVTTFAGGTNWKQVSTGTYHNAAIKTDGTLWTWGNNGSGQLGNNTTTQRNTPVTTFAGGTNWKQVAGGSNNTAAIKTDGTLWTWGSGGNGQLGNNAATDRLTPVTTFAGGTNWKQVAGGGQYTAAIKTSDDLQGI